MAGKGTEGGRAALWGCSNGSNWQGKEVDWREGKQTAPLTPSQKSECRRVDRDILKALIESHP